MSVPNKISYDLTVEPFQEDYTGRLSWATFGNLLLRVSSLHAEAHGFGYSYMQAHQQGWVITRLVVEADRLPTTGEEYALATWVNRIYRQFTDRLYTLYDASGAAVGHGFSTWALIDYATRQPVNLETLPQGGFAHALHEEATPLSPMARVRMSAEAPCVLEHRAAFSDLDINGHVNSIRYIGLALDSFDKAWHEHHRLTRIEVAYGLEGHCADLLRVYAEPIDEQRFALEVRRAPREGESKEVLLVRLLLVFAPETIRPIGAPIQ